MADHITRYDKMPIPPIAEHTEYFSAGIICIGVEYRVLNDVAVAAIRATLELRGIDGDPLRSLELDSGVSLHIFGGSGEQAREYLRFDCFIEEPHYHYVGWSSKSNEVLQIDPVADGDALAWALERVRTRLPQMLMRAGAADIAAQVDPLLIEAILPRVTETAYRARYRDRQDEQVNR